MTVTFFCKTFVGNDDVNINLCDLDAKFNKGIEFITPHDNNISILNRWNLTCARFSNHFPNGKFPLLTFSVWLITHSICFLPATCLEKSFF